ncbi:TMEM175 family protein [Streptomyces hyaluromycini]|uniref:TMEM175 family protein n=1 Tax=Streptomyces hyaluromycini TaxID=1377993 RepID=UPI000B5D031E|nr:TMEM175 family protein [Streptomyces hyaluromycini]
MPDTRAQHTAGPQHRTENTEEDPGPGGRPASPERLIYFSDAVVAIAITLLALELPVPTGEVHGNSGVLHFLREHLAEYTAFLVSFWAVAIHWMIHQRLFRYATGLSGGAIRWNLLWLLAIVLMPFTTKLLTSEADAYQVQLIVYAANQVLACLFFRLAFADLRRSGLLSASDSSEAVSNTLGWLTAMMLAFLISIPVALVTHWASLCWALLPVIRIGLRGLRRSPGLGSAP